MLLHQINLQTARLLFREIQPHEQTEWETLFDSPSTAYFLGLDPHGTPKEWAENYFQKVFRRYKETEGGMNALILKSSNKLVGHCGFKLQEWEGKKFWEIGYAILPEYRGKGYATEAAIACKNIAFDTQLCDEIFSIINVGNTVSEKVAVRNGMHIVQNIPDFKGANVNLWGVAKQ